MLKRILFILNPIILVLGVLSFILGTGISRYLGVHINPYSIGLGLISALFLLCTVLLFDNYFALARNPLEESESFDIRKKFRVLVLQIAYASLSLSAISILTLILTRSSNFYSFLIYGIIIVLFTIYSVPPLRLSVKGYGELILAVVLGTMIPAFAFSLQYQSIHRLVPFLSFPLTSLLAAFFLVINLRTFAADLKLGRTSLLIGLQWQRAVVMHHLLIFAAYLAFAAAPLLGFPWKLIWPVFLVLPFFIFQIYWVQRIANGERPMWTFIGSLATATTSLTIYLLALPLWLR